MSTTINTTVSTLTPALKAQLKAEFIKAAQGLLGAVTTFTEAVNKALKLGVTVDEVKAWGEEAGLTPQGVNAALRKAGIRQRALRCDVGVTKTGGVGFNVRLLENDKAVKEMEARIAKMQAAKDAGSDGDDKDATEAKGTSTSTPKGLAAYILRLCAGDKMKATKMALAAADLIMG
jgi:hypothetical protein